MLFTSIILSVSFKCTSSYGLANSYPKCQAGNECAPYLIHGRLTRCCLLFRNIVSTVNLDCKLELKNIALSARNAEYNPKVCDCGHCSLFPSSSFV
jgi:hypothetical protein